MPGGDLSGFLAHMHKAWRRLLHAEFRKAGGDCRHRDPRVGCYRVTDCEPKTRDLEFPFTARPFTANGCEGVRKAAGGRKILGEVGAVEKCRAFFVGSRVE